MHIGGYLLDSLFHKGLRFKRGPDPTITREEILGPMQRERDKSKFTSPPMFPIIAEEKEILRRVMFTVIYTAMSHHYCKFNNIIYKQVDWGP